MTEDAFNWYSHILRQAARTHQSQTTASDGERSMSSSIVTYYGLPFDPLLSRGRSDSSAQKPHSELNPSISSGVPTTNPECTVSSNITPSFSHQELSAVKPAPAAPVTAAASATPTSSKHHSFVEMPPPLVSPSTSQQPQQAHAAPRHPIPSQLPSAALLFQGHPTSARLTEEYRGIIDTSAILMNAIDDAMMDWE